MDKQYYVVGVFCTAALASAVMLLKTTAPYPITTINAPEFLPDTQEPVEQARLVSTPLAVKTPHRASCRLTDESTDLVDINGDDRKQVYDWVDTVGGRNETHFDHSEAAAAALSSCRSYVKFQPATGKQTLKLSFGSAADTIVPQIITIASDQDRGMAVALIEEYQSRLKP